jgi:F0F1-type ATP synthase delta subunit
MFILLMVFLGQCVFAVAVIFVLKKLLDRELIRAALEKFEACKTPPDIKEITVLSAAGIGEEFKGHLESIRQRKMPQANLNFRENAALKGGIVIAMGDILLDFSLLSRLEHFWS